MEKKLWNITERALFDWIQAMPNSAHIKEAESGKYITTNKRNLSTYGFSKEEDFIGLTLNDINCFMHAYWGESFAKEMHEFDEEAKSQSGKTLVKRKTFKDKNNFIRCQEICKTPLSAQKSNNKLDFILTMTIEYTDTVPLLDLYYKYRQFHKSKAEAVRYFTEYLGVKEFFYEQLTEKETICLLSAKQDQSYKYIAQQLGVSLKTVETHLSNIANKLKNYSVREVFSFLRSHGGRAWL